MDHLENFTYPPASPEPRDGGQGLLGFSNPALRRLPLYGYRISNGLLELLILSQA